MANFVPEGEDNSASKQQFGRRRPNFVPPKGFELGEKLTADEQYAQAKAANIARAKNARRRIWDEAVLQLKTRDPATLVRFLLDLPMQQREVYILAEETHANRTAVLQHFPAAGPRAKEMWREYTGSPKPRAKKKAPEAETASIEGNKDDPQKA